MFVRCKKRFKDGKEHRYWSVVENVRVSGGRVVQRQVLYLGEINDSQRAAWWRSIEVVEGASRSKQVALFPEDREAPELECQVVQVRLAELTLHAPRQWGACWLALTLWERLELDRFWGPRLPASREGTRWLDIVKIQVCYRLIDPGSDWRLHRQWYEHSALRDLLGCDRVIASTTLYRCLDKLTAHKQEFFSFLRARWTTLFNARFDILLYDLTSTYFESDPPFEDKRQFGHSRDKRRDCVQVVIALVVTPDGFPLAYEVMAGNTSDNTTLADFLTKIEDQYGRSDRVRKGVDHGPRDSDRGDPGGDARGRYAGALSGGHAQVFRREGAGSSSALRRTSSSRSSPTRLDRSSTWSAAVPRDPLARSAPIGRCQAPDQRRVLSVTLFRRGFLGLFLVDRGSICHIDPSSSESRAGAVRLEGQGGATVIAMITGVVVKMDWPAHPTPGSAGGG